MTLSRLLTLSFLCLLLAPKTWCAAESPPIDPDDNDRKFEALTKKSMLGTMADYMGKSKAMAAWNDFLKPYEKDKDAPLAPEYQQ